MSAFFVFKFGDFIIDFILFVLICSLIGNQRGMIIFVLLPVIVLHCCRLLLLDTVLLVHWLETCLITGGFHHLHVLGTRRQCYMEKKLFSLHCHLLSCFWNLTALSKTELLYICIISATLQWKKSLSGYSKSKAIMLQLYTI